MLPTSSTANIFGAFHRAADLSSGGGWAKSLCQQLLNFTGLQIGELCSAMAFAARYKFRMKSHPVSISDRFQSGSEGMLGIFLTRAVFKIRQAVISRVSVKMIHDYVFGLWPKKGPCNKSVNTNRRSSPPFMVQDYAEIALDGQVRSTYSALESWLSRAATNASHIRSFVQTLEIRNRFPYFSLEFFLSEIRIVISHISLRIRLFGKSRFETFARPCRLVSF